MGAEGGKRESGTNAALPRALTKNYRTAGEIVPASIRATQEQTVGSSRRN